MTLRVQAGWIMLLVIVASGMLGRDAMAQGACCVNESCVVVTTRTGCTALNGDFVGGSCNPNPCIPTTPTGACCRSGTCSLFTELGCLIAGGFYRGDGIACGCTTCSFGGFSGACCEGTSCSIRLQQCCTGSFQGAGVVCGSTDNPIACCPANFNRTNGVTVQDIFDFLAAYFAGDLLADMNGSGSLSVQDIFDFIEAYFEQCTP